MIEFSEQLKQIRGGDLDAEITEALAECVRAVDEGGGTASVTLKLTVKRAAGNRGYIGVKDEVTKKLPKKPAGESILFAQPDGTLWDDNPRQERMDLQPIEGCHVKAITTKTFDVKPFVEVVDRKTGEVVTIEHKDQMN